MMRLYLVAPHRVWFLASSKQLPSVMKANVLVCRDCMDAMALHCVERKCDNPRGHKGLSGLSGMVDGIHAAVEDAGPH